MGISHRLAETAAAMRLSKVRMLKDRVVKKKVWTDFFRLAVASKDTAQTPTGKED